MSNGKAYEKEMTRAGDAVNGEPRRSRRRSKMVDAWASVVRGAGSFGRCCETFDQDPGVDGAYGFVLRCLKRVSPV